VRVALTFTLLYPGVLSKFVPLIFTEVPTGPMTGEKLEIVGAPGLPTMKAVLLIAEPAAVVIPIVPVVAPVGTIATSCVEVAEVIVALTPLKATVF
jgi:hypothetical protein